MSKREDRAAFFYEHAGYSWDPTRETQEQGRRRCARELAEAEEWGKRNGLEIEWAEDYDAPNIHGDKIDGGPYYQAWVMGPGGCLASLGGIDEDPCPQGHGIRTPYAQVIEAELLSEARTYMVNGPSVEAVL